MARDLTLAARLMLDSQRWAAGLSQAGRQTRGFVNLARSEFAQLRGFMQSTTGVLAQVGAGYTLGKVIGDSAKTDQALTRIQQTAGMTTAQTAKLRSELQGMAGETGNAFGSLQEGFGQLIAGGLSFEASLPTIDAVNKAMRVTGSEATTLATALQAAQEHFGFDLSSAGVAAGVLDKMTVAGRAGVIEIEDLSGVFGSAAAAATSAGLSFEKTLALIEGMGTATTKDRVGTLVASTLRLFTNASYMKEAEKATGVKFFDANGARRDAIDVISDIKKVYDTLKTEKQKSDLINKAFGKADQDTRVGIQAAMRDGKLDQILQIVEQMGKAAATIERNMAGAMDNSVAQAGVLKERLAAAGDRFAQPINKALTATIQKLAGKKEDGGMDLSGGEMLGYGAGALTGMYAVSRVLKGPLANMLARFTGGTASLGTGVAMGTALEQAGAATPVFVVGAAPGLFGTGGAGAANLAANAAAGATAAAVGRKIGTQAILMAAARTLPVTAMATMGAAAAATVAAGVTAAAAAGWAAGSLIHKGLESTKTGQAQLDMFGRDVNRLLAFFGNKESQRALDGEKAYKDMLAKDGVDAAFKFAAEPASKDMPTTPLAAKARIERLVAEGVEAGFKGLPKPVEKAGMPSPGDALAKTWQVPHVPVGAKAPGPASSNGVVVPMRLPKPQATSTPAVMQASARPATGAVVIPMRLPKPAQSPAPLRMPAAAAKPDFRNVIAKFSSTEAATIAAAIAGKLTGKPMRGQLDVTVTDKRTTVTARPGGDFTTVRSSASPRKGLNTGRAMVDRR